MGAEAVRGAVSRAFGLGCCTGGVVMAMALILAWVAVKDVGRGR
jgi:hypothetical protein